MKLTIFFFLILIGGIYLVKEYAFIQTSNLAFIGGMLVWFSSILGLPFSVAYQIKEAFNLTYKQQKIYVVGIAISLITILILMNKYFLEYQAFKLENSNVVTFTKVDSVKYEKRGKLAPNLYFYYFYKVNGEQFYFNKENKEGFGIWQKILVKYDPDNPGNYKVLELEKE